MNKVLFHFIIIALFVITTSCYNTAPREDNEDCLRPDFTTDVYLEFTLDSVMSVTPDISRAQSLNIRYIAYIYNSVDKKLLKIFTSATPNISATLPLGKYKVVGWADYSNGSLEDIYFHSDIPSEMLLVDKYNYWGEDPHKMAYCGATEFKVAYRNEPVKTSLKPQMGQFKLVANDTADYNYDRIVITYPEGVPAAIDAYSQNISYVWQGVSYMAKFKDDFITSDNVITGNSPKTVTVQVEVYNSRGTRVAWRPEIKIPVVNGKITTCKTQIFTAYDESNKGNVSGGGINIKDDFDDITYIEI